MELTITFLIEIALVIILLGVLVIAGLVALRQRDGTEGASSSTTAGKRDHETVREPSNRREFFKSTGLGRNEEVKIRQYSPEEYGEEFGTNAGSDGMVAAVKAYRHLEDVWHEIPPNHAASVLDLADNDYEINGERGVLLLKKMPPGLQSPEGSF